MDANHPMAELVNELQFLTVKTDEDAVRSQVVPTGAGASRRTTDAERITARPKRDATRSEQLSAVVARIRETAARSHPRSTKMLVASEAALLPAPEPEQASQPQPETWPEPEAEVLDECACGPEKGQCSRAARLDDQVLYRQRVAAFFNPDDCDASPNTPPLSSSSSTALTSTSTVAVTSHPNAPAPAPSPLFLRLVGDVRERTTEPLPESPAFTSTSTSTSTCEHQRSALASIAEDSHASQADEEALDQQRSLLASPD